MTIGNVGGETEMDLTSTGYIDALLPRESEGDGSLPPDSLTSVNHLRQLPLPEQVKLVLFDGKCFIIF